MFELDCLGNCWSHFEQALGLQVAVDSFRGVAPVFLLSRLILSKSIHHCVTKSAGSSKNEKYSVNWKCSPPKFISLSRQK